MEYKEVILKQGGASPVELQPWTYKEINMKANEGETVLHPKSFDGIEFEGYLKQFFKNNTMYIDGKYIAGSYSGSNTVDSYSQTTYLNLNFTPELVLIYTKGKRNIVPYQVAILEPKLGIGRYCETIGAEDVHESGSSAPNYDILLDVKITSDGISWRRIFADTTKNSNSLAQLMNTSGQLYNYVALG